MDIDIQDTGNLQEPMEADRGVTRGFVTLNLLRLETQPPGKVGLGVAMGNTGFDEELGQITL